MEEVVLASACRTPIGKFLRGLSGLTAVDLGTVAVREALRRAGVEGSDVEDVLLGNVLSAGLGQNPARQVALRAGCPPSVSAVNVNKVCGSSLEAVMLGARAIRAGDARVVVAAGAESMSNAPHLLLGARSGVKMGAPRMQDHMLLDGLWDASNDQHMGTCAEVTADRAKVTREEADAFALRSHRRAQRATEEGWYQEELVPVEAPGGKGTSRRVERDEGIRPDTTRERLASLKPAFTPEGINTAGNSSQLSDGGSAVVLMARSEAERRGVEPLARIRAYGTSGVKSEWVMEAPIQGVRDLLRRTGLQVGDVDLVEHNEAYASASVALQRELGIPDDRFNIHGGAVALGHPLGASGARVLTTLVYALRRTGGHRGLATLCLGGGNAVQCIIERDA